MATKKRKAGRPKVADKVKVISAYLTESEQRRVERKFGNLSKAVRAKVLTEC